MGGDDDAIENVDAFLSSLEISDIGEISKKYEDDGQSIQQLASLSMKKIQVKENAQSRLEAYHAKREARLKAEAEAKAARRTEFEAKLEQNKGIQIGNLLGETAEKLEQQENERERQLRMLAMEEEQLKQQVTERREKVDNYLEERYEKTQRHYEEEFGKLDAERAARQAERQRKIDEEKAKKAEKKRKKEEMEKRRQARLAAKQAEEAAKS